MKEFKLVTVAEASGLDVDGEKTHDARYDVGLTREMFQTMRPMNQAQSILSPHFGYRNS
jgi:hypothetical protein